MAGGQRLNKPCILLIVIAGMERFTFKGVAANLVTYLTDVAMMSNSSAAKLVNNWCGFTSMVPLLVAPLADAYFHSYSTILSSAFFYILGLVALTLTATGWPVQNNATSNRINSSSLSWPLHLISLGLGGYNPSLQTFAVEQLEDEDELPSLSSSAIKDDDKHSSGKKSLFFQWWYFGICCGSLLGVSVMSYIQDTIGWGLGFAIPAVAMVVSVAVLLCANRFYVHKRSKEIDVFKSLEKVIQTVTDAAARFKNRGGVSLPTHKADDVELELQEKPLCSQDSAGMENGDKKPPADNGINVVKIAQVVIRLLPVWTMLLTFAVIFQQPATFFTKQGMTMKRNIGPNFQIPPAALQSAITVSIILLMPLYDKYFIPLVKIFTRNDKGVTVIQRMGIGMFLSVIAMVIAAVTDRKRLDISRSFKNSNAETVPMSIFWLLPQYILLGISDIFTVVGMQEFFYSEVPVNMRTLGIALYTSVFGFGSFFSSMLISMVEHFTSSSENHHGWFSDDMKEARLDNYYWFLALLSAVSLILFVLFCKFNHVCNPL